MRPDKFKRREQAPRAGGRVRRQIAEEAARRLYWRIGPVEGSAALRRGEESEYLRRQAEGRRGARPPGPARRPAVGYTRSARRSLALARPPGGPRPLGAGRAGLDPEAEGASAARLAEHLDRFEFYRLRLGPLEAVKQNPRSHPEGTRCSTASRSSSWPVPSGRTTRNSCWPPCSTTSARRSTRPTRRREPGGPGRGDPRADRLADRPPPRGPDALTPHPPAGSAGSRASRPTSRPGRPFLWPGSTARARSPAPRTATLAEAIDYLKGLESKSYFDD